MILTLSGFQNTKNSNENLRNVDLEKEQITVGTEEITQEAGCLTHLGQILDFA